jgi:tagaturonate epimerase
MEITGPLTRAECQARRGEALVPASFVAYDNVTYWLEKEQDRRFLAVVAPSGHPLLQQFHGEVSEFRDDYRILRGAADIENGRVLRAALPWLKPVPIGLRTSAGFGDRLGLATPGHVQALQRVLNEKQGSEIVPIFAQQSIREMSRTHRTPADVLNDATWGAFQAGWHDDVGADADHLKTTEDIDACAAEGYSFYTFDPGAYVDSAADQDTADRIQTKVEALPWETLESSPADLARRYYDKTIKLPSRSNLLEPVAVARAAAKYGRAIAHVVTMYRHLMAKSIACEVEVSVDETETPTTFVEHIYIARELQRLGLHWVSLAPRYIGAFEKGIEYIGDLDALAHNLRVHAEIADVLGPYKLSLHSGSDKFAVYPLIVAATHGRVHLKTAGTSYVEALRVIARANPRLFRDILALACERYPQERASYHVSAEVGRIPNVVDDALAGLLDDVNVRQIVHVTYGSALDTYKAQIIATLEEHAEDYAQTLVHHFYRHLKPFAL